jgi:hypothetical protein
VWAESRSVTQVLSQWKFEIGSYQVCEKWPLLLSVIERLAAHASGRNKALVIQTQGMGKRQQPRRSLLLESF